MLTVLRSLPKTVWVLGIVSLLTDVSSEMIHSILPQFLVVSLGASVMTVGAIEGIAEATASFLKVFSGAFSDYLGRRKELAVLGYGLSTCVKPLFALAGSPAWVLVARFGDRVGKGIRVAPRDALVADTTDPSQLGAAYGLRQSLDTVGAFLGPIVAVVLLAEVHQNFRLVFWVAVLPAVLAVGLLWALIEEPKLRQTASKKNPLQWQSLRSLGKSYWGVAIVALIFNLGNSSDAFILLKAAQVGISTPLIPLTLVTMNLSYSLSAYPIGLLSDRLNRRNLLACGLGFYALIYLGFAIATSAWQFWGLTVLYGGYLGMSQGVLLAIVADQVLPGLRGTAFGLISLLTGMALLPASILAGFLWQTVSPAAAFLLGSGCAIVAALLLIGLPMAQHSRE